MGIDVRPLVILSYVLSLWSGSTVTGDDFKCDKDGKELESYTCKPTSNEGTFTLPVDTPNHVQFLTIKAEENTTWSITQPDAFKKLSYLNTLHINTSKIWHISDPNSTDKWKNELFAVPSLQILRVVYLKEYNSVVHQWTLTEYLKHLYLENSDLDFDLKTCDNLYSLSLINASLNKIPKNNGLNFLAVLDLRKNTLKNLTALDLASFCSLESLNLRDAEIDDCECPHIRKLFDEMKKYKRLSVQYTCNKRTTKYCTSENWANVKKKREACLDNVASSLITQIIILMVVVGGVLFFIICLCVFGLRSLNKEESK